MFSHSAAWSLAFRHTSGSTHQVPDRGPTLDQHLQLLLALRQHIDHRVFGQRDRWSVHLHLGQLLAQVLHTRHCLDELVVHLLVLALRAVSASARGCQLRLVPVHHRAASRSAVGRVLDLLDLLLPVAAFLRQPFVLGLGFFRHGLEALERILLRDHLHDDLVDVAHARGILDLAEGLLVTVDLFLLLLQRLLVEVVVHDVRDDGLLQLVLALGIQVARGLLLNVHARLLALRQALRHLRALLCDLPLRLQLLVTVLPLLEQLVLQARELRARLLLRVGRVVQHERELLQVVVLRLQRALHGGQLVVEPDPLLLEALHDLLVGAADALRFVVLDHRLVQPVLERADLARHGRVALVGLLRLQLQVLQPVGQVLELVALLRRVVAQIVVALAQLRAQVGELGGLRVLRARRAGVLLDLRERDAQLAVLHLAALQRFAVLLDQRLRLLERRLALAIEQRDLVLQVLDLLLDALVRIRREHHGPAAGLWARARVSPVSGATIPERNGRRRQAFAPCISGRDLSPGRRQPTADKCQIQASSLLA